MYGPPDCVGEIDRDAREEEMHVLNVRHKQTLTSKTVYEVVNSVYKMELSQAKVAQGTEIHMLIDTGFTFIVDFFFY